MASGDFKKSHWRKSAQWKMLIREHARVIVDDTFVMERFFIKCPEDGQ